MEERVAELNSVYKSLAAQRAPWETWWDRLRDYVLPRRLNREGEVSLPNRDAMDRMTDTTAVEACQKLASGHMSYITPSHDVWFKWSAPDDRGGDEAEAWYNQCSEIALKELSVSNFYTEIHECFLDRVALGTGSLFTGHPRTEGCCLPIFRADSSPVRRMRKAGWIPTSGSLPTRLIRHAPCSG